MSLDLHDLHLAETRQRGDYDSLVEALTPELGSEFGQAIDWWCGIGRRLYELPYWRVFAAVDNSGEAQAVIGLYRETGAPEDEFWVGWFGVAPALRRKGIGTLLIEEISGRARNLGGSVLKLYTQADNSRALRFYEALGFRRVGTMADHGPPQAGSDGSEIILARSLE